MAERLSEKLQLLPTTRGLLNEAQELVGTAIELWPVPALANDARAQLHLPRGGRQEIVILYSERYQEHLDHLIAHELGHLRRLWLAPPEERLVPISTRATREQAARDLREDLQQLIRSGVPDNLAIGLCPVWVEGLISQLTNTPADLRIERQIRDQYPELRATQVRALFDQTRGLRRTLSFEVARLTPATIHEAALLMNYVLVREIAHLYGRRDLLRPFARFTNRNLAEKLYEMATSAPDEGHAGDRKVIELYAERLGIGRWFAWVELDQLQHWPEG